MEIQLAMVKIQQAVSMALTMLLKGATFNNSTSMCPYCLLLANHLQEEFYVDVNENGKNFPVE